MFATPKGASTCFASLVLTIMVGILPSVPNAAFADDLPGGQEESPPGSSTASVSGEQSVKQPVNQPVARSEEPAHTISGTILNADTHQPLVNALVVLKRSPEAHEWSEARTNIQGKYVLTDVPAGEWSARASADGMFAQSVVAKVTDESGVNLDFSLDSLEGTQLLRVTGKRTLVHPENVGSETHLNRDFLQQYGSGNSLKDVIATTPGVLPDSFGNIIVRGEHNAINYTVDGAVLPEIAGSLQQGQFASPRSLQSIDMDIGGYQASDGGGPLGAVAHMKTLPFANKPFLNIGTQIGGPMYGAINIDGSAPLSQDSHSVFSRFSVSTSGAVVANAHGLEPPGNYFKHDNRLDINLLSKLEYRATEQDVFRVIAGINETFLQIPSSPQSYQAGVRVTEHDRSNYVIASHTHRFRHLFDTSHLYVIAGFYSQKTNSKDVFDPNPVINGDQLLQSVAPHAARRDYPISFQGDISKTVFKTHHLLAGFLSEVRPVSTNFSATYFNNDPSTGVPVGAAISPFTSMPDGPQLRGSIGKFHGFRFLQSAYFQDTWKPSGRFLRRLTLDTGVRWDYYKGVFGSMLGLAQAIADVPGVAPFDARQFARQTAQNSNTSGRFGASFVLTKNTVLRGSFSGIFTPPPVDLVVRPFDINGGTVNGIWNGALRPLNATTGKLIDISLERQVGPRFVTRANIWYKNLKNVGDELPIDNTLVYQRLTLSRLEAYGVEVRAELRPGRDKNGFNAYLSNTVSVAYLRGSKHDTGGTYDLGDDPGAKYIDHDRREQVAAGIGYRFANRRWVLATVSAATGFLDDRSFAIYGFHAARSRAYGVINLGLGYSLPKEFQKRAWLPKTAEVRIVNLVNQQAAINLGSPYQGTRYLLPIQVIGGLNWQM